MSGGTSEGAAKAAPSEGWFGPPGGTRFHYFDATGRSLCRKWVQLVTPQKMGLDWGDAVGPAQGDCTACATALAKREAKT